MVIFFGVFNFEGSGWKLKGRDKEGHYLSSFELLGGLGLVRLLAHLKANKLSRFKAGGGLDLLLRPIWFSHTVRWSTKELKGRDRHGGALPGF